ncbi:hypothetical protein GC101_24150 [Paenibacillus sp. LMG 31459]|uniref:DUF4367 domain-containing protein n=1 Tax=Paenibacillus phytohabitans TaxID=2654978 RepID=A0ABX1YLN0_9BACL|nr:hypothetical protein [Paenibacillus phytohabitans]NOU81960.1 hypothetical protein [Paenibacillus phytohabitans]
MNSRANGNSQPVGTDEAWAKLQEKLGQEPVNPVWAEWGKQEAALAAQTEETVITDSAASGINSISSVRARENTGSELPQNSIRKSRRPVLSRSRKWAAAAAGVAIFAAILATPVGNTAMAAILNQFRMQDVAVVEESDLRDMFYQVSGEGDFHKTMNSFGTFSIANGTVEGKLPVGEIQGVLGYEPLKGQDITGMKTVEVSPSRDITLTLNVDEVNQALKRVGSNDLLPESVDGKPLTLHLPEIVNYDLSPDQEHWATLSQMNTPVVTVDPSIDIDEALDAVVNFPLIPDYLRSDLQKSRILSGDIPMPLIKGSNDEQITVADTPVILTEMKFSRGYSYSAVWVQDGQMLQLTGGDVYPDRDKFIQKVQELITQ